MSWVQLHIAADAETAPAIGDVLGEAGAVAVTFADAGDEPLLQQTTEALGLWSHTRVTGLFEASTDMAPVIARLETALGQRPAFDLETVADQDWTRSWMDRFQPMHFGGRLWIVPSWQQAPDAQAANVVLDPGQAFGTGTHASTALCLRWLAEQDLNGKTVIDYGCGSGILAIAALKLGARTAVGTDTDPVALAVSCENAARNGVADRYRTALPGELSAAADADIVLANILAEPLIALADTLQALLKPGGWLVLAGLLAEQAQTVMAAYPALQFGIATEGEWARLVACHAGATNALAQQ